MDELLKKICDGVNCDPEDKEHFGDTAKYILCNSDKLHDPLNKYEKMRRFIKDQVAFQEKEMKFKSKYVGDVYHPNVVLSLKCENYVYNQILKELEKLPE